MTVYFSPFRNEFPDLLNILAVIYDVNFLCFKLSIVISSWVEISSCWCCLSHFSCSPLHAWKSVAALIWTRAPLEPSFVVAVWVTCPWEQCWSHLLASRCHWAPALHRGRQVLSPAARYWWQPWATAAAFSKPFSRRATCPDPPLHTARSAPWPTQNWCKSAPWGVCSALPGPPRLRRIFPYSGARKTVFLDPQRCSLGFETVCVFLCFWAVVMEKTFESPLDCKEIQPVQPKGDQSWVFIGRTDVEAETPLLWPPDAKSDSLEKTLNLGKMRAGGEGDDRGWDGWMASLTQWTWVWVNSGSWLWTGRPDMLQSMGSQRVGHDWVTKLNLVYF